MELISHHEIIVFLEGKVPSHGASVQEWRNIPNYQTAKSQDFFLYRVTGDNFLKNIRRQGNWLWMTTLNSSILISPITIFRPCRLKVNF